MCINLTMKANQNKGEKMEKEIDINEVECMWYWENDHRKSSKIFVTPKNSDREYVINKTPKINKLIKEKGVRFYTCDDDYKDGDDYRYGYFYPARSINHDPVDQMEGDGHIHLFSKENEKYKQI